MMMMSENDTMLVTGPCDRHSCTEEPLLRTQYIYTNQEVIYEHPAGEK
jgi:hypothetical protein